MDKIICLIHHHHLIPYHSETDPKSYLYSIGYPACCQAANPPRIASTLRNPLSNKISAARALDCSSGQVQ